MTHPRVAPLLAILAGLASLPAWAQSIVSTHSGVLYFFEGSVFIENQPVEQKFGRFPDIGQGGELRTERGRAEVLLTPGVFLRLGENSSIRMISTQLSDTRVELLAGSAIVESSEASKEAGAPVTLIHKNWQVQLPQEGVYRIDADPPQVLVYKGQAQVLAEGETQPVDVKQGETLPLAAVLVPDQPAYAPTDPFKTWAMTRSQAIASDNAIAQGIIDDPTQVDNSGLAQGAFSYYPYYSVPSLGLGNPYGLSFWSPYQPGLTSLYVPTYLYSMYPGWPSTYRYQLWRPAGTFSPSGTITPLRIGAGGLRPSGVYTPGVAPRPVTPHVTAPRPGARVGGHR